jgi:glycosyltransferase involved in cell wall biosynthesis
LPTNKVLLLVGTGANRIGGVEILVRETALQLRDKGMETIAVFHAEPTPAVRRFFDVEGLTVKSLPDLSHNPWRNNRGLRSLLKQYRPDIVHWQFLDPLGPLPWLSWWYGAKRVFFTNQGSCPEGFSPSRTPFLKRGVVRLINWHLTGMFCVSDYLKGVIVASGRMVESRIHRIYNAVTLPDLRDTVHRGNFFRRTYNIPEKAPVILQVSWLIPEKGLEDFLQAARLVLNQYPDARFVIAGEGHDRAKLEKLAAELGIAKSVIWTGFLENPTQSGLYDAADIVCQLSRWEEAFGYVIAEGMSFAKPVVATSVGGIPEVVTDEKTGLLTPRRDPQNAAAHICRLLADPALRRRLGEAGYRMVQEKFNVVERVHELLSYYGLPAETDTRTRETIITSQAATRG